MSRFRIQLPSGVEFTVSRSHRRDTLKRRRTVITRRPDVVPASFAALSSAIVDLVVGFLDVAELLVLTHVSTMLQFKAQSIVLPLAFLELDEPFGNFDHCGMEVPGEQEDAKLFGLIGDYQVVENARPTPFMTNRDLKPTGFPQAVDRVFDYRFLCGEREFSHLERNYVLLCSWLNDDGLRVFGFFNANCCYTGFDVIGDMVLIYTDSYEDLMENAITRQQKAALAKEEMPTRWKKA